MHWQEIAITTNEMMQEAVTNLLYDIGAAGVVIEDPQLIARYLQENRWDAFEFPQEILDAEHIVVKAYLPVDECLPELLEKFSASLVALASYFDDYYAEVNLVRLKEEDWANCWKKYYKPQKIGECIVVVPSWEEYEAGPDEITIKLDPGMAFGTGSHSTTCMCVNALEKYMKPNACVADVGTGSGILAITAAKLGAKEVMAIDLDTLAVRVAKENVKINKVEKIVTVKHGNLLENVDAGFDIIVANIISTAVIEIAEDAYSKLNCPGYFVSSGIIEEKLGDVLVCLKEAGYSISEIFEDKAWRGVVAKKE